MSMTTIHIHPPEFIIRVRGGRRLHAVSLVEHRYRQIYFDRLGSLDAVDTYAGFSSTTLCGIEVGTNGRSGSINVNSKRSRCKKCLEMMRDGDDHRVGKLGVRVGV